jgi:hypothetical protein
LSERLVEGMNVMLYAPDDFEVVGRLVYEETWLAVPDWQTLRRL